MVQGREGRVKEQVQDQNCFSLTSCITLGSFFTSCGLTFLIFKMGRIDLIPREGRKTHVDAL